MRIHVHLGVHKTATTALQGQLASAVAEMRADGIGYLPLNAVRKRFTHAVNKLPAGHLAGDDALRSFFFGDRAPPGLRGILVSDENLVGSCGPLVRSGRLYADLRHKMEHLRAVLEGHELRVFVSIRSFDRFFASAYCEGLLAIKEFVPFAEYRKRLRAHGPTSWMPMLDSIAEALRPESMHVWRYEDLEAHAEEVLRSVAFGLPIQPTRELGVERASFSQVAIAFLEHANRALGPKHTGQLLEGLEAIAPKRAGFAPFVPWSEAERADLQARYADDVARIPGSMWLIAPGGGIAAERASTEPAGT